MGSAFHWGLEYLISHGLDYAVDLIRVRYAECPDAVDAIEWAFEGVTVEILLCGYAWRWENEPLKAIATEQAFELPLINPATGAATPLFAQAGKIDGIVELQDGRQAVLEHKLLADDLNSDSNLWRRLQIDSQITTYVAAARRLGFPVDCVLYDVARKPTIRPGDVPELDENGLKIVLDAEGHRVENESRWRQTAGAGFTLKMKPLPEPEPEPETEAVDGEPAKKAKKKTTPKAEPELDENGLKIVLDVDGNRAENKCGQWKQSADKEKGHTLLVRPMTLDEWADRLLADITERPDFYYARKEIARLDVDVKEYESEIWAIQQTMREAQRSGRHYRTVGLHCDYCSYFGLCTANYQPGGALPEGYLVVLDVNPELKGDRHEHSAPVNAGNTAGPSDTAGEQSAAANTSPADGSPTGGTVAG